MRLQFSLIILALSWSPSNVLAQQERMDFKCTFVEQCGSLNGVGCFDPGASFLLSYEEDKGFSVVMYNEVWTSNNQELNSTRNDLTNLIFGAPSGEMALLTVDEDWVYSMTIHYTGAGEKLNWESGTGQCKIITP